MNATAIVSDAAVAAWLTAAPRLARHGHLELSARRVVDGLYGGRHRSAALGSAVEFADHRAYQPGDDLRAVDWKAYARCDHLLVRRYREERDLPLCLVLDVSASMDYGEPAKSRWSALAAAALALLALDQGDRVRLLVGGAELGAWQPERGGPAAATALCARLAALTWRGATDLPRVLRTLGERLERRSLVVLLSDLLVEPATIAPPLAALAARGHDLACLQVLDRSELALSPAWGLSALADPEAAMPPISCDAPAAKAGYDRAIATHVAACARVCAAARADHLLACTDQHPSDLLGPWLMRRRRR